MYTLLVLHNTRAVLQCCEFLTSAIIKVEAKQFASIFNT